jgi:hypothetical protein
LAIRFLHLYKKERVADGHPNLYPDWMQVRHLRVKLIFFGQQRFLGFRPIGVRTGGFVRADRAALRLIEKADALRATVRINFKMRVPHADRLIGAFRFADAAAQAFIGYFVRHVAILLLEKFHRRSGRPVGG